MPSAQRYDTIGQAYTTHRHPDPRLAAQIWAAVGEAERMVNVGAGTGSYERPDYAMVSVEPSAVMISQRGAGSAPVVRAAAEALPFPDQCFDVGLALMTVHHWTDLARGLSELARVSVRQVVFTFEPGLHDGLWIFEEYVPAALSMDRIVTVAEVADQLGTARVEVVPIPADCTDGFGTAYWCRPERYLDPEVRANISIFARLDSVDVEPGLRRLERDLANGAWLARHGDLMQKTSLDCGLRLVVTG